ncbi:MAG: mechanosensitive ion channel family protein [Nanoarchaeota archaeon]|nr:mechanosensitive ion channel family protein [Nanoarchaeota archaeon]
MESGFLSLLSLYGKLEPIIVFIISFMIYIIAREFVKKKLYSKVRTKTTRHNVTIFANIITYIFVIVGVLAVIFSYTGNVFSIGLTAGLLSAALGWALQRPITGIAAWIMVVFAKPFKIGDRIVVGGVRGDVSNITLTHIYLREFGGTIGGEETSGRVIMVPNSVLFEKDLINYTLQDEYILDEVTFAITFESNIDKAKDVCVKAVKRVLRKIKDPAYKKFPKPYMRFNFQNSGVDVRIRYHVPADRRLEYSSRITEEIFRTIQAEKSVDYAYPHTEIVYRK